jgi:GxxExxY protein
MVDDALTATIIGCSFKIHKALGSGFLEKGYENALRIDLVKQGLRVKQQEPIKV